MGKGVGVNADTRFKLTDPEFYYLETRGDNQS